jgi:hypothetical protein
VIHSWWVPALGVKQDAIPGFVRDSWLEVDKPGTYRGQCRVAARITATCRSWWRRSSLRNTRVGRRAEEENGGAGRRSKQVLTLDGFKARGQRAVLPTARSPSADRWDNRRRSPRCRVEDHHRPKDGHIDRVFNGKPAPPWRRSSSCRCRNRGVITYERTME